MRLLRDTAIWIALLIARAVAGTLLWGTVWCLPFLILYGSAQDSRWHE